MYFNGYTHNFELLILFSDIYFSPSLDIEEPDGLYDTMKEMMKDMFLQATLFPRIDPIVPIATYEGNWHFAIF